MNRIDLDGRVAIVTGAASGLGRAAALRFAQSGAFVELWDIDEAALNSVADEIGRENSSAAVVDVTRLSEIEAAAAKLASRHDHIDILLNSAGIPGLIAARIDYPPEEWQRILSVNLSSVFYCCRTIVPFMQRNSYGRVINVSSMAGKNGNADQVAYVAAKAGVIGVTKSLGKLLAGDGILVNCIAPGIFETPLTTAALESNPDFVHTITSQVPLGRMGHLEEFAAMASWLASEECSFTTGFTFDLSGGRSTY